MRWQDACHRLHVRFQGYRKGTEHLSWSHIDLPSIYSNAARESCPA
jgi:hypothetical protein